MNNKNVFILLLLISISFFSFRGWIEWGMSNVIVQFVGFLLIFSSISIFKNHQAWLFRKEVMFYCVTFLFTAISSYILYKQSFYGSFKASLSYIFAASLYFLLHKYKLSEESVIKILTGIMLVYTSIEIVEQFTYPNYWFCGRIEKDGADTVEMRMGLWRMYVYGIFHVLLIYTILLQKVINTENTRHNLILMIVAFVGIVLFLARKDIYAAISVIPLAFLFSRGSQGGKTKAILAVFILAVAMVIPSMMKELNEQTSQEIGDEGFIRYIAAEYFMNEMNDSPLYYLFGAGIPGEKSTLSLILQDLKDYYHIYQSDCGFIGYFSKTGIIGLLPFILIFIKIFRNYKYVDLGLLLYSVILLELSFFDFFGQKLYTVSAFFVYLYFVECSIERNKQLIVQTRWRN